MGNDVFDPLNILLFVGAIIVFWRLRSVLGTRTGEEKSGFDPYAQKKQSDVKPAEPNPASAQPQAQDVPSPTPTTDMPQLSNEEKVAKVAAQGSPLYESLLAMANMDDRFDPKVFLERAETAHEMIITAYAQGDKKQLKPLLSKEVYQGFSAGIDEMTKQGRRILLALVGYDDVVLEDASLIGSKAELTLKFKTRLIRAVKDQDDNLIEGDEKAVQHVQDLWTFKRDLKASSLNWQLISTD